MPIFPAHGGDLSDAERRFGVPEEGWLDLSTGISPFSYPQNATDASMARRLPDHDNWKALQAAAARYYRVENASYVAPVPGVQASIRLLSILIPPCLVTILGPTYGTYEEAFLAAGHKIKLVEDWGDLITGDLAILVHPNNPDGRFYSRKDLQDLAEKMARQGKTLLIDEAFCDCWPDLSMASMAGSHLLVLRSFGKFFGLAGLRLGFVLASPEWVQRINAFFDPWSINGPAAFIGKIALSDEKWIQRARNKIRIEAGFLDQLLSRYGFFPKGNTLLFRMAQIPRAWALYEDLGRNGILTRPFAHSPDQLRIGLTKGSAERLRLERVLEKLTRNRF